MFNFLKKLYQKESPVDEIKEIATSLEINARKLAILLYCSSMPEEIKDSWIALLPEMSFEEIDQLLAILEASYLDEQTRNIDEEYRVKIEKLTEEFEQQKMKEDQKTVDLLQKLAQTIS